MPKQPPWFPANRGQKLGKARTTRRAVDDLLDELELTAMQLVTADLARSAADIVDAARAAQDPKLWLSASTRLEGLLGKLVGASGRSGGSGVTDGQDESGGDDPAARLASLVGEPASVGDEA